MAKLIWVVDDDEGILDVTRIVLTEAGFDVETINSEKKLEKHLQTQLPHLILLDVLIGGVDGADVARKLKKLSTTKEIPIIMMSANIDIKIKALESGVDDYIKKPYDILDLEKMVRSYLDK